MKAPAENAVLQSCLALLRLHGIFAWRNNNHATYDRTKGVYRRHVGLRGVSDVLGVLPGGRFLALEVKRPGGKASAEQKLFLDAVRAGGGLALLVSDVKQLEEALKMEGVIP